MLLSPSILGISVVLFFAVADAASGNLVLSISSSFASDSRFSRRDGCLTSIIFLPTASFSGESDRAFDSKSSFSYEGSSSLVFSGIC